MQLQTIIIDIILRLSASPIADKTSLMLLPTMHIQLILPIKSLSAESTFRMALETALIDCSRVVVSLLHMFV